MIKLYLKAAATTFVMTCGVITGLRLAFKVAEMCEKSLTITLKTDMPQAQDKEV